MLCRQRPSLWKEGMRRIKPSLEQIARPLLEGPGADGAALPEIKGMGAARRKRDMVPGLKIE